MYNIGWPLWKVAAKAGLPIRFQVMVHFDEESKTFWADSPHIDGLIVSGANLEEIRREALAAATDLLDLELNHPRNLHARPSYGFGDGMAHA